MSPFTVNSAKLIINPYLAKNTKKRDKERKRKVRVTFFKFYLFIYLFILFFSIYYTYTILTPYTMLTLH